MYVSLVTSLYDKNCVSLINKLSSLNMEFYTFYI